MSDQNNTNGTDASNVPGSHGESISQEKRLGSKDIRNLPVEELQRLVHEFQGRQLELESQNQSLREALKTVRKSDSSYRNLFNSSPTGHVTEDFFESKQAQEALRMRDDAIDSAGFGIGIANPDDMSVVYCNRAFARMWGGKSQEDVIGIQVADLFNDEQEFASVLLELQGNRHYRGTLTCRRHDGTTFEAEGTASVLEDEHGSPILMTVSCIDVTDRNRVQRQMRTSRAYLRSIFDTIPESVYLMRRDGVILAGNKTSADRHGLEIRDFVGKNVFDLIPPELTATRKVFLEQAVSEKANVHWEDVLYGRTFENSVYPVLDDAGRVDSMAVYAADITERKQAENLLADSEKRYRLIVETAHEGILTADKNNRITYINKRGAEAGGYSVEEMTGQPLHKFLFQDDTSIQEKRMESRLRGESETYETRVRRKDGSVMWILASATPITDDHGTFLGSFAMLTDITDRKKAENDLRKSLERYRLIADYNYDWEYWIDDEKHFLYVSPSCERITGYSAKEFKDDPSLLERIIHPGDQNRWLDHLPDECCRNHEGIHTEDFRIITRSGDIRWIAHACQPVFGESGIPIGRRASNRDITDRINAEEALTQSERRYKGIFDGVNQGILIAEIETLSIKYANSAMRGLLGYSADELEGLNLFDIHPREQLTDIMNRFQHHASGLKTVEESIPVTRKDGTIFHAQITSTLMTVDNVQCCVGFFSDMTATLKATEARELLAAVVEHSSESIIITNASGDINYVNPAFERVSGYSANEVLGQNPRFQKSDRHDEEFYKGLWKTVSAGGSWNGVITSKKKGGALVEEDCTVFPIKVGSSGSTNYVAIKRDITRESSLQRQLLQAQKLEALGNLAGGIAHDFNNVIFGIIGYTDLAMNNIPEDSRAYANLERVMNAAKRSGDMVQQILAFSRQGAAEKSGLDLRPLVKEGLKFLRAAIPPVVSINSHILPGESMVLADPTQIHQVLMNLCVNASHAIGDRTGTISVDLSEVEVQPEFAAANPPLVPGKVIRLKVTDTGSGITPENIERIFDPYFTTKEEGKGTGLGLSVVYGIVADHGGVIKATSEPSKGSTFEVFLPVVDASVPGADKESESPSSNAGKEHILIVDDEAFLLKMYEEGLTKMGYKVTSCYNPKDALKLFLERPDAFDIVISDYAMPEMTGVELTSEMVAIRPGIPIIICSGAIKIIEGLIEEQPWISDVIPKPTRLRDIANAVRNILDH